MENNCKTCPFKLDNLPLKNILLILLTAHTVWNMFKETSEKIPSVDDSISKLLGQTNMPNVIPMINDLGPLLSEIKPVPSPPKLSCDSGGFITKICLILIFIYIIYFIKTIVERISVGMELNVNTSTPCVTSCPLGFGGSKCPGFCNSEEKKNE